MMVSLGKRCAALPRVGWGEREHERMQPGTGTSSLDSEETKRHKRVNTKGERVDSMATLRLKQLAVLS